MTALGGEDAEGVRVALDTVFRRLLANLMLDYNNPMFRSVRCDNKAIQRNTAGISEKYVEFLFHTLGFKKSEVEDRWVFFGLPETLKAADATFSSIEKAIEEAKHGGTSAQIKSRGKELLEQREALKRDILQQRIARDVNNSEWLAKENANIMCVDDFTSVESLKPMARKALLNSGRIRNCFFEAKSFTLRRMSHGRVYACFQGCADNCLEAHWHLLSGKNLLYSYVAHLSSDATTVLHLGIEHGYQYNGIPGTENFGNTVHFTAKLIADDGTLKSNEHPNKPCGECIYCSTPFSQLFL